MSNDLEIPNCPKKVMRTYSNKNRNQEDTVANNTRKQEDMVTNNMRKQAIKNNLSKEEKDELQRQMGLAQSVTIQMTPVVKEGVM